MSVVFRFISLRIGACTGSDTARYGDRVTWRAEQERTSGDRRREAGGACTHRIHADGGHVWMCFHSLYRNGSQSMCQCRNLFGIWLDQGCVSTANRLRGISSTDQMLTNQSACRMLSSTHKCLSSRRSLPSPEHFLFDHTCAHACTHAGMRAHACFFHSCKQAHARACVTHTHSLSWPVLPAPTTLLFPSLPPCVRARARARARARRARVCVCVCVCVGRSVGRSLPPLPSFPLPSPPPPFPPCPLSLVRACWLPTPTTTTTRPAHSDFFRARHMPVRARIRCNPPLMQMFLVLSRAT